MSDNEMRTIIGGAISSTLLNAISRLINTLVDFGRTIGSSISRIKKGTTC